MCKKPDANYQLGFYRITALLLLFLTPAVCAYAGSPRPQTEHTDKGLNDRIAEGISLQDRLWLRGVLVSRKDSSGALISLGLADNSREVHFQRGVLAMSKEGNSLWVLRQPAPGIGEFVLSVWKNDRFEDVEKFNSNAKDKPFALQNADHKLILFSPEKIRILSLDNNRWEMLPLKGKLRNGLQKTTTATGNGKAVYIGFNTGEWGGGLQRVDLATGQVADVQRRDTKQLCAGPLNKDCDPVTALVPDPRNADCIFAAVGLVHMMSEGRILRICRDEVSTFFEKTEKYSFGDKEITMTQPIFGLAVSSDGSLWAISPESLYRLGPDGNEREKFALPKPATVSGVHLSRGLQGMIVVWTDANWAVSVSGFTPLLVPLQDGPIQGMTH